MSNKKKNLVVIGVAALVLVTFLVAYFVNIYTTLPQIIKIEDYQPLLVSKIYDRNNKEIGEFYNQRRVVIPFKQIPTLAVRAFMAAEDSHFYEHSGINFLAIARATLANIKAGRKAQGGSTISQQVAKTLFLSSEKTITRKIREVILTYRMEANLSKDEIMYLYLNQIFFGHGAYGIEMASQIYFQKHAKDLTLKEAAILAGLPQAPSRYSPILNPLRAKERQQYVLRRMAEENFVTKEEADKAAKEDVTVFYRQDYKELAPYYVETVRQVLNQELGEETVLNKGLKIYTGLDLPAQIAANQAVEDGLRELDKRQGFRGAEKNLTEAKAIADFLDDNRKEYIFKKDSAIIIKPDGTFLRRGEVLHQKTSNVKQVRNLPYYIDAGQIVEGIVQKVDDKLGLTFVQLPGVQGVIDVDTMKWARAPDPTRQLWDGGITRPSQALKVGDIIEVKAVADKFTSDRYNKYRKIHKEAPALETFASLQLEQEPAAEAALLSFDENSDEIIAMVGGYDFKRNEFNRTFQAARQTGSSFKPIVYLSALDKGYAPNSVIVDSPIVYEELVKDDKNPNNPTVKKWKPHNYSEKFSGDVLFRNALIHSLNIPTIKVEADVGLKWVEDYARRLGIFSFLNPDQTMGLGSSSVTLYEMTKVFAQLGKMGKRLRPLLIQKVEMRDGKVLLEGKSLDDRFKKEMTRYEEDFDKRRTDYFEELKNPKPIMTPVAANVAPTPEPANPDTATISVRDRILGEAKKRKTPPFFYEDPEQLIDSRTAYIATSLLSAVVEEGTGAKARALARPSAGKTGTTNGFYDAWYIGYTPQIATGVWVGYDSEKSLGAGETGAKAALPIWLSYMTAAHKDLPERNFSTPPNIVLVNIDNVSGLLATANSKDVARQAFLEGTEPTKNSDEKLLQDENEFYKEELSY